MSRGREIEDKQTNEEEIEGYDFDEEDCENAFEEEDLGEDLKDPNGFCTSKRSREIISSRGPWIGSDGPSPEKIRKCETNQCLDHVQKPAADHGGPKDADDYILSQFSDELETVLFPRIPSDLETIILAKVGILDYKNYALGSRISKLVENRDLLKARKMNGIREACVFMLASGEENWWAFDQQFTRKTLPRLPCDVIFKSGDSHFVLGPTYLCVVVGLMAPLY